ncbi:K02A2.6-like [Cordylochernes scorpioides]|uniref:K02A2.6-like n=1 Tax=Cordylochernes scorpioides TaxID=51811 RepID=A0ABY6L8H7_9ARAC|nr:K02A2.6-like [Cordylochernes scorpioides]
MQHLITGPSTKIDDGRQKIEARLASLESSKETTYETISVNSNKILDLERRLEASGMKQRKSNLIFYGLEGSENETPEESHRRKLLISKRRESITKGIVSKLRDNRLRGVNYYVSNVIIPSSYWQVEIEEEDKSRQLSQHDKGLYKFNAMPFSLCNASVTPLSKSEFNYSTTRKECWQWFSQYPNHCYIFMVNILDGGMTDHHALCWLKT